MSAVKTDSGPDAHATAQQEQPPRWLGTSRRRVYVIYGVIVLGVFFLVASDQWLTVANYTMIAAIAALGLNVLSGYAGQVSLGIAFFMAIGAYTAAWLGGTPSTTAHGPLLGLGLSFLIWLPAAGIVAALAGALVGPTALRLKGFYLGIVSLALIFIGQHLFNHVPAITHVTGGPQGRSFPAPAIGDFSFRLQNTVFGIAVTSGQGYFLLLLVVLTILALFVGNVMRSRTGRAFQAVRDNETGATIMGVNLFGAKMGAFILSSFIAGIAGALFASYSSYIIPTYWDLTLSIQFVAAIIIGGIASVWGSILGAVFVFALPQVIDLFNLLPQQSSTSTGITSNDLNIVIYGLLILAFLLFEPGGIVGLVSRAQRLAQRLRGPGKGGESARATPKSLPSSGPSGESPGLSPATDT